MVNGSCQCQCSNPVRHSVVNLRDFKQTQVAVVVVQDDNDDDAMLLARGRFHSGVVIISWTPVVTISSCSPYSKTNLA